MLYGVKTLSYSASEWTVLEIGTRMWKRQTVRVLIHINGGNIKLSPACHDGIQGCGAIAVLVLNVSVDGGERSASALFVVKESTVHTE